MFNKKKSVKKASAFQVEINNAIVSFTTMVESLNRKAEEAEKIEQTTAEEIKALQQECDDLHAASVRARSLATKISDLFN